VNFIDKQNGVMLVFQLRQQALEALFKIAAVLGTRQQRAQIEGIDHAVLDDFRHIAVHHTFGQAFGNGGFTHARFTHQ